MVRSNERGDRRSFRNTLIHKTLEGRPFVARFPESSV